MHGYVYMWEWQIPIELGEGDRSVRTEVTGGCEPSRGGWELNSSPL